MNLLDSGFGIYDMLRYSIVFGTFLMLVLVLCKALKLTWAQSIARNMSKILVLLLVIALFGGFVFEFALSMGAWRANGSNSENGENESTPETVPHVLGSSGSPIELRITAATQEQAKITLIHNNQTIDLNQPYWGKSLQEALMSENIDAIVEAGERPYVRLIYDSVIHDGMRLSLINYIESLGYVIREHTER